MTDKTPMPFGKHKGVPLDQVPKTYLTWLFDQDGAEEKYPDLFDWFCNGNAAACATIKEVNLDHEEEQIFLSMPTPFRAWWNKQYGTNLRKVGSDFLLPYLRVATSAWQAANEQLVQANLAPPPSTPKPSLAPRPPTRPPLSAAAASILANADMAATEEVPF